MLLILLGVLAALVIGAALKVILDYLKASVRITTFEYALGAVICSVIVVPLVTILGVHLAKANKVSFNEYYNGYETAALSSMTPCTEDGSCQNTYQCDEYFVTVTYTVTVSDGNDAKGNPQSHQETRTRQEPRWHDCPYATAEYSYSIQTTLGNYPLVSGWIDLNARPWRGGESIPGYIHRGQPASWLAVQARLAAGTPGPVTKRASYDNYILASQSTILKKYGGNISSYKAQGLLPKVVTHLHDEYQADKVYFVGVFAPAAPWESELSYLDAALGSDLKGDLHLVVVKDSVQPDEYLNTLMAYWQSPAMGKNAISKNAIVVVVGTDGNTVSWARAATGMPVGNEALLQDIQSLKGTAFTPDAVIGRPEAVLSGGKVVSIKHSQGALDSMLWGVDKFSRVCMTCHSKGDKGTGFSYLKSEIQPSTGQKVFVFFTGLFLSLLVWGVFVAIGSSTSSTRFGSTSSFSLR